MARDELSPALKMHVCLIKKIKQKKKLLDNQLFVPNISDRCFSSGILCSHLRKSSVTAQYVLYMN